MLTEMLKPQKIIFFLSFIVMFGASFTFAGESPSKVNKASGSLSGRLTFSGELPLNAVEQVAIAKNPEVCGGNYRKVVWVDVKEGALRGAFVFIEDVKGGKDWKQPPGGAYVVDQKGCRFSPWAQVVRPGPITIRNSDKIFHNVNIREIIGVEKGRVVRRTLFNFGQPDPGDIQGELKPRRSRYISITCEAHNFMFGFILAPENPYAVVVNADGTYLIDDIPPGTYTIKAWHPKLGIRKAEITVPPKGRATANFNFTK